MSFAENREGNWKNPGPANDVDTFNLTYCGATKRSLVTQSAAATLRSVSRDCFYKLFGGTFLFALHSLTHLLSRILLTFRSNIFCSSNFLIAFRDLLQHHHRASNTRSSTSRNRHHGTTTGAAGAATIVRCTISTASTTASEPRSWEQTTDRAPAPTRSRQQRSPSNFECCTVGEPSQTCFWQQTDTTSAERAAECWCSQLRSSLITTPPCLRSLFTDIQAIEAPIKSTTAQTTTEEGSEKSFNISVDCAGHRDAYTRRHRQRHLRVCYLQQ